MTPQVEQNHGHKPADAMEPTTITDAMALRAARELSAQMGESHDAMWSALSTEERAEFISGWRSVLLAAFTEDPARAAQIAALVAEVRVQHSAHPAHGALYYRHDCVTAGDSCAARRLADLVSPPETPA